MKTVQENVNRDTLDSLRIIRRKLYSIPEVELSGMSLEDQSEYGSSLHQTGLAILKLEAAKLKGVNDDFKKQELKLKSAAFKLEADIGNLLDAVKVIRVIGEGLKLITNIVNLLA